MFQLALQELKGKISEIIFFSIFFIIVYTVVDNLVINYSTMSETYGLYLVIINIILNLIMSVLSSITQVLSIISMEMKNDETKASHTSFIAFFFSIMTYGCTSCVISFIAIFGITYSIPLLPLAGLPYKFLTLFIIVLGLVFMRYEINKPCKIPKKNKL